MDFESLTNKYNVLYHELRQERNNRFNPYQLSNLELEKENNIRNELVIIYDQILEASIEENKYCITAKINLYKIHLQNQFTHLENTNSEFSIYEQIKKEFSLQRSYLSIPAQFNMLENEQKKSFLATIRKRLEYLKIEMYKMGIDVSQKVDEYGNKTTTFQDNIQRRVQFEDNRANKNIGLQNKNPIKWKGTQTELIELLKALIEAEKIQGTQKEIIKTFADFLQIEIKNPDKLIQDIKLRSNGSETLFLDNLKKNLLIYFQT